MGLKLGHLFSLTFLILNFTLILSTAQTVLRYECIDNLNDYETNQWSQVSGNNIGNILYAVSGEDLPKDLKGKLNARGIFYMNGRRENQGLIRNTSQIPDIQPIFIYLKYYGHGNQSLTSVFVEPALFPDHDPYYPYAKFLPPTQDFQWGEVMIETFYQYSYIGVGRLAFWEDEFFLVDRIILAQGEQWDSIEEIKTLCGWGEESSTTTTTMTSTEESPQSSTTENGEWCTEPGYFPDPDDCSKYHFCEYNEVGDLWDTILTCEGSLVWCQESLTCRDPVLCPCSLGL